LNQFPTYSVNYNSDLSQISNIDDNTLYDNILDYDDSFDSGEWFTNENPPFRPLPPPVPPPRISRRNELLSRNKVTLEESKINPFLNSELKGFDTIIQEVTDFCSYNKDDPNNVLFLYNNQTTFINRDQLKDIVDTYDDKIVYQCRNKDEAFQPRNENIIGGPYLNMDVIGLFGVMIPLEQLDDVISGTHQIFVVEPIGDNKGKIPIASLNTRLGGNVVSANHCQEEIPIEIGNISYVTNDVLRKQCANRSKIGGTRRKNIKKKKQNKSKSKRKVDKNIKK